MDGGGNRPWGRKPTLAVGAETLAMAVIVTWGLGTKSLQVDEGFTVAIARVPTAELWHILTTREANQSLYYLLVRPLTHLGATETWLRALPAAAAVATVPVLVALGRRLFDERVGLLAGLLLCLNGFVVAHAQFGRAYSLAVLLAVAATLLFVRAVEQPTRRRWVAWAVVGGLACYAHFFAGLVLVAQLASLPWRPDGVVRRRSLGAGLGVLAVAVAPLAVFVVIVPGDQVDFIDPPTAHLFAHVLTSLAGHGGPGLLLTSGLLGVVALGVLLERRREGPAAAWPLVLVLAWLAVPIVLAFALSVAKPIVQDSYLLVSAPALTLLGAVGLDRLFARGPRAASVAAVVAVLALGGRSVAQVYGRTNEERWREATALVLRDSRATDGLMFVTSDERTAFEYYIERQGRPSNAPEPLYPSDPYGELVPLSVASPSYDTASLERLLGGHARIWVLQRGASDAPHPRWRLPAEAYRMVETHTLGNVDVSLYEPTDL